MVIQKEKHFRGVDEQKTELGTKTSLVWYDAANFDLVEIFHPSALCLL